MKQEEYRAPGSARIQIRVTEHFRMLVGRSASELGLRSSQLVLLATIKEVEKLGKWHLYRDPTTSTEKLDELKYYFS